MDSVYKQPLGETQLSDHYGKQIIMESRTGKIITTGAEESKEKTDAGEDDDSDCKKTEDDSNMTNTASKNMDTADYDRAAILCRWCVSMAITG